MFLTRITKTIAFVIGVTMWAWIGGRPCRPT